MEGEFWPDLEIDDSWVEDHFDGNREWQVALRRRLLTVLRRAVHDEGRSVGSGLYEVLTEITEAQTTIDALREEFVLASRDPRHISGRSRPEPRHLTWRAIGEAIGMTKQGAEKRWSKYKSPPYIYPDPEQEREWARSERQRWEEAHAEWLATRPSEPYEPR